MDEKNANFSFYTLLPGEECLLELQVASFDDNHENANVTAELTGIFAKIKKAIDDLKERLLAPFKCGGEGPEAKKRSVFVVTNMRCFIASYYSIKGANAGCFSCSAGSVGSKEYTEYTAFPRNVLTEYNSYTCKKEKYLLSKSCTCFCGKKVNVDKYNIVLTVGLNTKGEKSNIAPARNLVMTLEEDAVTSYDQLNGVIAMLAKLAQQAND